MAAEPERLTGVLTIDCDHLGERTASAAYILTLKVSYDCRPAPQHVMSWHLGQIGRGSARVAGTPMTVAYGPADHAYEVAASAEGPVGRGGRSRPIASFAGCFTQSPWEGKGKGKGRGKRGKEVPSEASLSWRPSGVGAPPCRKLKCE